MAKRLNPCPAQRAPQCFSLMLCDNCEVQCDEAETHRAKAREQCNGWGTSLLALCALAKVVKFNPGLVTDWTLDAEQAKAERSVALRLSQRVLRAPPPLLWSFRPPMSWWLKSRSEVQGLPE